ncbi:hypothetical protein [Burkholderia sp. BCC0405]|uniref:hypothetical protein n=1 Tax=Burkholderia sp. BCC0405 TaxID=2676298 RepID=UPI00158D989D|nr:hypothetical protein [Burkholderia sp. BCC0405]
MSHARWSKQPSEIGLRRVVQGTRGFNLKKDGEILASVRPLYSKTNRFDVVGWYWYGFGNNTCRTPVSTPEEAKAQAMAAYKACET